MRQWLVRRDRAAAWLALSLGALGLVVLIGPVVPSHPHSAPARFFQRLDIALLVLFPYLLYRFTTAFSHASRRLALLVGAMTLALVVWSFALPRLPATGESWSSGFVAYIVAFLVHWTLLAVVVSWRLWRAGRSQPRVSRRRMQMLALGAAAVTVAILVAVAARSSSSPAAVAAQVVALVSAIAFYLGLAPPRVARQVWRRPEDERLRGAIENLMSLKTSEQEVADVVLPPMASIVGAKTVALRQADGREVARYDAPDVAGESEQRVTSVVDTAGGAITIEQSPYAPFFGDEERQILRTLGALTFLALDRVRLFVNERDTRLALERADEVKTNFIALAAHELRTPATTIYGFIRTLNELGDRIDDDRNRELHESLERQAERMTALVEQLLDLSRLDAEVVEIAPQSFQVRERVEDIVDGATGGNADAVSLDIDGALRARADLNAFDRIVSNLLTNAFRYGEPPVRVSAERRDRHLRVWVEDSGPGVPVEFVPDLFERFTRETSTRARAAGTGLGLSIARSYARAHDGDLLYESAAPHGARFQLVLPQENGD